MRHAAIGAAAAMTGTVWTPEARAQQAATEPSPAGRQGGGKDVPASDGRHPVPRPRHRQEVEGPGDDGGGRVLQGRSGPIEFAHDRADAHHLRLLPALHETAGRPAGAGHGPQGASVRQPERDRQGARHRTRVAGGPRGEGARHSGSNVPRRDDRQAAANLSGYARWQGVRRCRWPTSSTTRQKATSRIRTP